MSSSVSSLAPEGLGSADDAIRFRACVERLQSCRDLSPFLYGSAPSSSSTSSFPRGDPAVDPACLAMAQTVATLISRLDDLADPVRQQVLTPREVLLELVDIVRHGLCLALQHYTGEPRETSREAMLLEFNAHAAVRQIPIEAVVEGLHSVGYVSTKLRLEKVALQLHRRLQSELHARGLLAEDGTLLDAPTTEAKEGGTAEALLASDASTAALHVTYTLLEDFQRLFDNTLRLLDAEVETGEGLLSAVLREYYRLTDWVLLAESATQVPAVSFTTIHKVEVDLVKGEASFVVHRPTSDTPWGLLFNEKGRLIDVDVAVRGRRGARDLHQLLRCATEGARVVTVNNAHLVDSVGGEEEMNEASDAPNLAAERHRVLMALREASQGTRKRMQMTIRSPHFQQAQIMCTHVAAFAIPFQGSEWAGGQCAMLVMQRLRPNAALPVEVDATLRVVPLETLDGPAREFLARVGDRVRVLAVNGVEVFSPAQAQSLMVDTDTVMLTLVMTSPPAPHDAVPVVAATHTPPVPSFEARRSRAAVKTLAQEAALQPLMTVSTAADVDTFPEVVEADADDALVMAAAAEVMQEESTLGTLTAGEEELDATAMVSVDADVDDEAPLVALQTKSELLEAESRTKGKTVPTSPTKHTTKTAKAAAVGAPATESQLVNDILREFAQEAEEDGDTPAPAKKTAKRGKHAKAEVAAAAPAALDEASVLAAIADEVTAEDGAAASSQGAEKRAPKGTKASRRSGSSSRASAVCEFENGVKVLELTTKSIVLERPSTKHPWGIEGEMASDATDFPAATGFRITKLPSNPLVPDHPFLHRFEAAPPTWYVAGVNQLSAKGKTGEFVVQKMRQLRKMTLHIIRK